MLISHVSILVMFRLKRVIIYLTLVIAIGVIVTNFLSSIYEPAIIMYHSINPVGRKDTKLVVSVNSFQRQIHFLKKFHYNVISLENLGELISKEKRIPQKTVVITFDDGFKDNFTYAFPILKKYQLPATFFIIVSEVGLADRLNWQEIRAMQGSGLVSIGSHTLSHPFLTRLNEERQRKEIFESKIILEERLGQPVKTFSYPNTNFNERIKQMVKQAGFKLAVTVLPEKKFSNDDLYALRRIPIYYISDNLLVFWLQTSGYFGFLENFQVLIKELFGGK